VATSAVFPVKSGEHLVELDIEGIVGSATLRAFAWLCMRLQQRAQLGDLRGRDALGQQAGR
jgi:hypothetical protein